MVYLGAVPTALAFSTWAYALARMDAGKLGVTTYLVPPLVILLGWLLLDDGPPALAFVDAALCVAGDPLSRRRGRAQAPVPAPQEARTRVCGASTGGRAHPGAPAGYAGARVAGGTADDGWEVARWRKPTGRGWSPARRAGRPSTTRSRGGSWPPRIGSTSSTTVG